MRSKSERALWLREMSRGELIAVIETQQQLIDVLLHGDMQVQQQAPALQIRCRVCGCTDLNCSDCVERTGEPCYWAEPGLCSACATEPVELPSFLKPQAEDVGA